MLKIVICGNYGASNIGDEAILAGILRSLAKSDPRAEITVLSANPPATVSLHSSTKEGIPPLKSAFFLPFGFRSFYRGILKGKLRRTLKAIKDCDYFLLGGGGLFSNESWKAVGIWGLHALVACHYHKPLFICAQSIEKIKCPPGRFIVKRVFKKASAITVRDPESKEVLSRMGIKNVILAADPAWLLPIPHEKQPEDYIVFSLRPWKSEGPHLLKTFKEAARILRERHHLNVKFLAFQTAHQNDLEVFGQMEVYSVKDFRQALEIINSARAVVGMRLHSNIFAAICGKPFIAIAYSPKVESFARLMGLEKLCIPLAQLTSSRLEEAVCDLLENYEDYQKNVAKNAALERALARGIIPPFSSAKKTDLKLTPLSPSG